MAWFSCICLENLEASNEYASMMVGVLQISHAILK